MRVESCQWLERDHKQESSSNHSINAIFLMNCSKFFFFSLCSFLLYSSLLVLIIKGVLYFIKTDMGNQLPTTTYGKYLPCVDRVGLAHHMRPIHLTFVLIVTNNFSCNWNSCSNNLTFVNKNSNYN